MSDAAAHAAGHDDGHHVDYMAKAYWLVGLTVAEVIAAVVMEGMGGMRLGALAVLAMWKAGIVGAYYMHLSTEPRSLKFVALAPLALVCALTYIVILDGHWLGYAAAG